MNTQRWEYLVLADPNELHSVGRLNELGDDGWEMISVDSRGMAYFKRFAPEKEAKKK